MNRPYFENKPQEIFIAHYKKAYNFESHFHSFIEIAYCFKGAQQIKIGESNYILKDGDAVVIFPNMVHEYIVPDDVGGTATETVSVMCNLNFLSETFPQILNTVPECPFISAENISENSSMAFEKIYKTESSTEQIGWAYIILSDLFSKLNYKDAKSYGDIQLPALVASYINDNFSEPLSIKYIARKFGYSPSYIAHLFCDQLKIPFKTYLNAVRCDFAQHQISSTKKSITEIAHLCGYNSLNTFCRCFKNHTGKTPSEFKKVQKQ